MLGRSRLLEVPNACHTMHLWELSNRSIDLTHASIAAQISNKGGDDNGKVPLSTSNDAPNQSCLISFSAL